ncbi:MAG: sigma-54 dependent transcriptional regulator [Pseudomonadota bacterium]|nr:sigma-54 dependent transcriptional regulator [Pseudomonadota bacterium]
MAELAGDPAQILRESFAQARGKARILLIEDEALFARAVKKRLEKAGHECALAGTLANGRELLRNSPPELILLDLRLPDGNGFDFLAELRGDGKAPPVIVLTAYGEISDAVQAMKLGAGDYLKKPVDLDELLLTVEKATRTAELHHRLDYSRERDSHAVEGALLLGESAPIRNLREQISHLARIAPAESQPNVAQPTVLITGETGAGKDVAARLLHLSSANRAQPFVQVDCASLPRELIEAELFGHEKGAFTGSHGARPGLIEAAENGALFLDEVGELPLELQVKLLNVLERRKSRRLGSVKEYTIGARIMAATNRDLPQMIAQGSFRADLYYRLNVITLTVPPLRARGDDIVLLARHFAEQTGRRYGLPPVVLAADALPALCAYHWPGNVRELKHVIDRAALLGGGRAISASDLGLSPQPTASHAQNEALASSVLLHGLTLDGAERLLIERALRDCNENVSEAARRLGVSRMTLRYRMEKYSLKGS